MHVIIGQVALLSVGEVAGLLGVSPSTVRAWGARYGLTASAQTDGGHRRYTDEDVRRLRRMHAIVLAGTSPADAAAKVTVEALGADRPSGAATGFAVPSATRRSRPGGPGGAVLAVPRSGRQARGLARAASRLDEMSVEDAVVDALADRGTLAAWDDVVRPVLVAAGEHWQRTGNGIEIEHLLTQAVTSALVRHISALPALPRDNPVLLAGGPHEEHVLALHAVRAELAERGVPARLLGPRTPMAALAAAARRTRAAGVLVWISQVDPEASAGLPAVAAAHRRMTLVVGGPGWDGLELGPAVIGENLTEAAHYLEVAWTQRSGRRGPPSDTQ